MAGRHLSLEEAAKYLHLTVEALQRMIKQHEVPFVRHGERLAFDAEELDAWASQRILNMGARGLHEYHRDSSQGTRGRDGDYALICSLFNPKHIVANMRSRTKAAVLRDLVGAADKAGLLYAPADLIQSLVEREAACSTGMTGGVALVHPRHHDPYLAPDSFVMLARTAAPLPFGAPDGENTDIFFLICCLDDRLHLHTLARLCAMINTTTLLTDIRTAGDADAMYATLCQAEQTVLEHLQKR